MKYILVNDFESILKVCLKENVNFIKFLIVTRRSYLQNCLHKNCKNYSWIFFSVIKSIYLYDNHETYRFILKSTFNCYSFIFTYFIKIEIIVLNNAFNICAKFNIIE